MTLVRELVPGAFSRVATVGLDSGDWRAKNIESMADGMSFEVWNQADLVGQFSIPILILCSSANAIIGFHTFRKRGQFSSTLRVQSRPTKVFVFFNPSFSAANMTFFKWSTAARETAGSGSSGFG